MTDPHRPDPPARDPALDAAWKAHSTEVPPTRIDAAILAAAHRETRSRPRAVGDDDANARGPSRAWWGLAAAATIGAIAFGVVQLVPPQAIEEQAKVASDAPQVTPAPAPPQAPVQKLEAPAADPVSPPEDKSQVTAQREPPVAAMRAPAPPQGDAKPADREQRRAQAPASAAPESPSPPPAAPQPFPGAGNTMALREAPALLESETQRAAEARADDADALRQRAAGKLAAAPARSEARSAPGMGTTPREAERAARTPAAWIDEIRKLYETQRFTDAARELNAFRTAYVDADTRLPESLRAWAATVARN